MSSSSSSAAAAGGWKNLPDLPLTEIGSKLLKQGDFKGFSSMCEVCKDWRADTLLVLRSRIKKGEWPKIPFLLLSSRNENKNGMDSEIDRRHLRDFYSLLKRSVLFSIPLHRAEGKRLIQCGFGWILAMSDFEATCLMNPFTGAAIRVPRYDNYPGYRFDQSFKLRIERAVLNENPSTTPEFVLAVCSKSHFGFWRKGEPAWKFVMYKGNYGNAFQDLCFSIKHDSFIALGGEHNVTVWAFDPYRNGVHVTVLDTLHAEFGTKSSDVRCYIVDCRGELLILAKNGVYPVFDHVKNAYTYGTTCFLAFKVDFRSNKLVRVFKLNHAFFVGHNATLYVRPDKVHGITTGIYFTDDCEEAYSGAFLPDHDDEAELGGWRAEELALTPEEQILAAKWEMSSNRDDVPDAWKWGNRTLDPLLGGGRNSGIYHLDDGTIESLDAPETLSRICPPIWVAFPPQ